MTERGFTAVGWRWASALALGIVVLVAVVARAAPPAAAVADPVVVAAGDIACDPLDPDFNGGNGVPGGDCQQRATSDLVVNAGASAVLPLGDIQYYCGGYGAFLGSYDPSWGRTKAITRPAVGNHEYLTSGGSFGGTDCDASNAGAAGYFDYFNGVGNANGPAGERGKGYYSFDVGAWHLIALNSQCGEAGGCGSSSPQGQWLAADLAAHPNQCTLAYWHIPLFSSGGRANANTQPFFELLYAAGAELVLTGHDHLYERFAPQRPDGTLDAANGIREFVVGTGGSNYTSVVSVAPNSEVRNDRTFGVLKLTLHAGSYDWQFVPVAGASFTDSGSATCHGAGGGGDQTPPTTPSITSASAISSNEVRLSWSASTDNVGVTGYTVYRNGTAIATVGGSTLSYTDLSVSPNTTYSYTVDAFDQAGNRSAESSPASVTTPGPTTLTFRPVADTYVDSSQPSSNFGTQTRLRADSSPEMISYLRFNLSGLQAVVTSAKLRFYPRTDKPSGLDVRGVTSTSWGESTTTYQNRPAYGAVVASTPGYRRNRWQEVDVTSLVTGNGLRSFALTTGETTTADVASREASQAAQLVVTSEPLPPAADTQPPSAPVLNSATAVSTGRVDLAWSASDDNVGVAGYRIYRNNAGIADVGGSTLSFSDTTVSAGTTYSYSLDAVDAAGNRSQRSNSISVTTPSSSSLTFAPVADTYVNAGSTSSNYGTSTTLRTDADPDVHSYLRFNLSGLGATVSSAKLRVYANSSNSTGYQARGVTDTLWGETTTTYDNQPAMGAVVGSSGSVTAGTWTEVDVTPLITGNGLLSLAMTSTSSTNTSFASREAGATAPQLVVTSF